jgi:hypothetical protein
MCQLMVVYDKGELRLLEEHQLQQLKGAVVWPFPECRWSDGKGEGATTHSVTNHRSC